MGDLGKMRNYDEVKVSSIPKHYFNQITGKVLDIGCNECILPEKIKIDKKNYVGLDIDLDALSIARKKGFKVKKVDLNNNEIPIPSNTIDSLICLDILEHLQDPVNVINKIKKTLKPKARGIISLPNDLNLINLMKVLILGRPLLVRNKIWDPYSHLHFPSLSESRKLMEKNFKILSISYIPSSFTAPMLPKKLKEILVSLFPRYFAQTIVFLIENKE